MKLLFISLIDFDSFSERNIYTDLLREFIQKGHEVYCISPVERKKGGKTHLVEEGHLLKLRIGNIQKTNIFEKGFSILTIEKQMISAIKKYFKGVKFDLILYPTPPITFANVVKYIKKRDGAKTYLMLKDIFPQNAVDLGMMKKTGIKGLIYKYFRRKEKKLYALSDKIGCMSQANVDYVLKHNPEIPFSKVEICPNSIEPLDLSLSHEEIIQMRLKYDLPLDKKIFVYGGNLGKPQGIPFIIDCIRNLKDKSDVYFLIVGDGTEYGKLLKFVEKENPANVRVMSRLPKDDYDKMIAACDVGMIFLDYRFTIPNIPQRLLSYMQAKMPVLACTDSNTDLGKIITEGGFGWWCESNNTIAFAEIISNIDYEQAKLCGQRAFDYLNNHYTAEIAYKTIIKDE